MPEFTRDEHDDMVFPELYAKQRSFKVGDHAVITFRNVSAMQCGPLAHECPLNITLDGQIVHRPMWADKQSIALYVENTEPSLRLIRLRDINAVNGRRFRFAGSEEVRSPKTWNVPASRGDTTYTVTNDMGSWSCTCPGFKYHSKCKHIESKQ